jgi:hypothetical protein
MVNAKKQCTTRRTFCKRVAGVAFTGAFVDLETTAIPNPKSKGEAEGNGEHLAAACGTYCGACPAYIAKHGESEQTKARLQKRLSSGPTKALKGTPDPSWMDGLLCDGCLSGGMLAAHCQNCAIRKCAANKQNDARCTDCEELPCYRITNLINMGSYLHRKEYLPNLKNIREMGAQKWVKYEQELWTCPNCNNSLSWYDPACSNCGAKRSEKLFSLGQD